MENLNYDTCPEIVLAAIIIKIELQKDFEKFIQLMQKIGRFGPKISEDKIINSPEQLTKDQCKWFLWWKDYLMELSKDKSYECIYDDVINGKTDQIINPAGNWQHYEGITFV